MGKRETGLIDILPDPSEPVAEMSRVRPVNVLRRFRSRLRTTPARTPEPRPTAYERWLTALVRHCGARRVQASDFQPPPGWSFREWLAGAALEAHGGDDEGLADTAL